MTSRVFVVQQQLKVDRATGEMVPKFPSVHQLGSKFGEVEYLLTPTASPFNPQPIVKELHEKLRTFCDSDYLLLIGNPCIIGWATAIACMHNDGRAALLQWHGRQQSYTEVRFDTLDGYQPV